MRVQIKSLGPIEEAVLDLEDITVLIGPPNVGKTYTLKAIYSLLSPLDPTIQRRIIEQVLREIFEPITSIDDRDLFTFLTLLIIYYKINPNIINKLINSFNQLTGTRIDIREKDKNINIVFRIIFDIDLNTMEESIKDSLRAIIHEVLPITEETRVNIKETLPPALSPILKMSLKSLEDKLQKLERSSHNYTLKVKIKEIGEFKLIEESKLSLKRYIVLSLSKDSPLILRAPKEIEVRYLEHILERMRSYSEEIRLHRKIKYLNSLIEYLVEDLDLLLPTPMRHFTRYFYRRMSRLGRPFYEQVMSYIIEGISKSLTKTYQDILGINSVLFIPFGRSQLVYQLEEFVVGEFEYVLEKVLMYYMKSNAILYSYTSKLERGRNRFSKGKYDDTIIKIFRPILQGDLRFDEETRELKYRRWGFEEFYKIHGQVYIPMKWVSALSSEVSGILLPILDIPSNSCILIEEPESQLHPSAQVLMALGLVALSKLYGHKIIVSTHSDIFAYTLACVNVLKPDKEHVLELIRRILEMQGIKARDEDIEPLAETVSRDIDNKVLFYYYQPTARGVNVIKKTAQDIMYRSVPGITDTLNILVSWAMNLP